MRLLLQKVTAAQVTIDGQIVGSINDGYLLFLGVEKGDLPDAADWLARKVLSLRLFPDAEGDNKATILQKKGEILVVSQFTLAARTDRGTKPDFTDAAPGPEAEPLYERFIECLRLEGASKVATGRFGAFMSVQLTNNGPYTLWLTR